MNFKARLPADDMQARWKYPSVALIVIALWMLLHPYQGIVHDSSLYTLGALARLHPELLSKDVFLRFGSQDQYTLFSPIFGQAIELFGLEPAAAVLTLISHFAFFSCAWLLARRFMPAPLALLSVGLLVAMPSGYGAFGIFKFTEDFLTPRQFSETFVLAGFAAALVQRYWVALLYMVAAILLHPIMAAAGVVIFFCFYAVMLRPKASFTIVGLGAAAVTTIILLGLHPLLASFDSEWLGLLLGRSAFLFLSSWSFEDWIRTLIPLSVLTLGALIGAQPLTRRICTATLLTACGGLLITAVACDLFQIIAVTRIQPWRWLWIANFIAILLLPLIARDAWRAGSATKASILLVASAWIFRGQNVNAIALGVMLLALALAILEDRIEQERHLKLVFLGACALLTLSIIVSIGEKATILTAVVAPQSVNAPPILERLQTAALDGVVPAAFLILAWLGIRRFGARADLAVLAIGVLGCAALFPYTWGSLARGKHTAYTESLYSSFADWRRIIPPRTEVLWPDMPVAAWYWLERPSYISLHQIAGIVFSRESAIELQRRTVMAAPLLPRVEFGDWLPKTATAMDQHQKLPNVCRNTDLRYVVTLDDLGVTPLQAISPYPKYPNVKYKLYSCAGFKD